MASVLVDSENQIWAITNWGNSGLFKLNKAEINSRLFRSPMKAESMTQTHWSCWKTRNIHCG